MGIYLPNMEMPPSCRYCDFRHMSLTQNAFCTAAHETIDYMAERTKRLDNCPLVPVPPHGIIDREQILDAIRLELAQANAVNDMEDYDSWMRVFDYVRKFPTVIPASEEG